MTDRDIIHPEEALRSFCFGVPIDLLDLLEWAVVECLLRGRQALPSHEQEAIAFPYVPEHPTHARRQFAAARAARRLLADFAIPQRKADENLRPYHARVADALERFLATRLPGPRPAADASAAADTLLRLTTIHHPMPVPDPRAG